MISDDDVGKALDLLDRIGEMQYHRIHQEVAEEESFTRWHRPEDVLTAMMVIDCYDTKAIMNQQMAMVERRMREMGLVPDKVKLDG